MGRLIEGMWDCQYCGSIGIGGSKRECPNCGKVRDIDTKFYMPSEKKYVPEEEASKINRNPDWVCRYCDNLNSDSETVCKHCGAERTSENLNYFENRKIRDSKEEEPNNNGEDEEEVTSYFNSVDSNSDDLTCSKGSEEKTNSLWQKIKSIFRRCIKGCANYVPYIISGIVIIAVAVGLYWIFSPKIQEITVEDIYWERSIVIERYQTVDESGWSLPDGARLHKTRQEVYTYQKVVDHYENRTRQVQKERISGYKEVVVGHRDLGNGYFEEITERVPVYETYYVTESYQEPVYKNEPVYKTKYYYEIDKWLYDRTLKTAQSDKSPYWADTSTLGKDEREAKREEKYYIKGTNSKGKTKEISMPYNEWSDLMIGDKVKIKVSIFGNGELV